MSIRLVGLDLDGTVFNDKKQITERTKNAIKDAIKKGIIVMPATGRPRVGLPDEFLSIDGVRYALICNGASIIDLSNGKPIYRNCMEHALTLKVLKEIGTVEGSVELYINGEAYSSKESMAQLERFVPSPFIRQYVRDTRIVVDDLIEFYKNCKNETEKINLSFGSIEIKEQVLERLSHVEGIVCTSGLVTNIEINKSGADKGQALLDFGKSLGIGKEEIMACGDSSNDLEMIKKVGIGVAMANADPAVIQAADRITLSNEEDGVAFALEHFI
ncbi:MAG: Cof-type HAD-IIB family hydrolase [Lachnospiraceae bacterium]